MIVSEFDEIRRILYGRYKICNEKLEVARWYNELKAFDLSVVKEAVNDWITNDGWKPEVINIVERCKDVERWRKQICTASSTDPNEKTVACPYCCDSGLVVKTYPSGVRTGEPCEHCYRGKANFPWKFLTEEEKRDYNMAEIKAGRSVPNVHVAPDDFRKAYLYGNG